MHKSKIAVVTSQAACFALLQRFSRLTCLILPSVFVNEAANDSARVSGQDSKKPPALGTNQIAGFGGFSPLTGLEKTKNKDSRVLFGDILLCLSLVQPCDIWQQCVARGGKFGCIWLEWFAHGQGIVLACSRFQHFPCLSSPLSESLWAG